MIHKSWKEVKWQKRLNVNSLLKPKATFSQDCHYILIILMAFIVAHRTKLLLCGEMKTGDFSNNIIGSWRKVRGTRWRTKTQTIQVNSSTVQKCSTMYVYTVITLSCSPLFLPSVEIVFITGKCSQHYFEHAQCGFSWFLP